jgi:hypothetical protein
MSSTASEVTVEYMDGRTETIHYGWAPAPKDGLLHLLDVENTSESRTLVLANVRSYTVRRIR